MCNLKLTFFQLLSLIEIFSSYILVIKQNNIYKPLHTLLNLVYITIMNIFFRTRKAMSGKMTFQEALKIRLDLIQPSLTQVRDFIRTKLPTLTPGVK